MELLKRMECWEGGVKGMEYYAVDGWNIGKVQVLTKVKAWSIRNVKRWSIGEGIDQGKG